jgi:crotonobetainyl-CoA:carnitine CoA-transferase CaiB-like acyl-CoA transferase
MTPADRFLADAGAALGLATDAVRFTGRGVLAGPYAMTDLGAACLGAAGAAVADLLDGPSLETVVDRPLATGLFHRAVRPLRPGGQRSPFHPMSRDFATADGRWIRFQANYPHLRAATLAVLGCDEDGEAIAAAVAAAGADELEQAVVDGGGAAAASRTAEEWAAHPQGRAVAAEPLVAIEPTEGAGGTDAAWEPDPARPLAGVRVLDITRVLAGPMATRFLAGYGAEVLRIDPPGYDEPNGIGSGDLTLGKRCGLLDLRDTAGRRRFEELLAEADVFVHGLRPGALDGLDLSAAVRQELRPGLIEVTLDAYGWTGPWRGRRGFDTLVQNSTGLATTGMAWADSPTPYRWPLSILDHSAGYLMAAAAIAALTRRRRTGAGSVSRVSLARVAGWLHDGPRQPDEPELELPLAGPVDPTVLDSPAGLVRRLAWPARVEGVPFRFDRPGDPFGSSVARWIGGRAG